MPTNPTSNQQSDETVELGSVATLSETELDDFLVGYSDEEIEAIAEAWQKYASPNYQNLIISNAPAS